MIADLRLAWRLARRELRSGFAGSIVFLACLTLGVAAIAAVGVINAGVLEGLEEDSAALLGGDLKIESTNRPVDDALLGDLVPGDARRSDVVRTNGMAYGRGNRRVVVGLKVVDDAYPLYGSVTLDPPDLRLAEALSGRGAAVERGLLARLDVELGDRISIGEAEFVVRAVVEREPDRIGGFVSIGPRVFIHQDDLAASAIIQPGSLARFDYRFALPPDIDPEVWVGELKAAYAEADFQVNGVRDIQPRVTRVVDRLASFLTIAGLASLLIGGVGVALAIQNYLTGKIRNIATLKCLGAKSQTIFRIYLLQVLSTRPARCYRRAHHRSGAAISGSCADGWIAAGADQDRVLSSAACDRRRMRPGKPHSLLPFGRWHVQRTSRPPACSAPCWRRRNAGQTLPCFSCLAFVF